MIAIKSEDISNILEELKQGGTRQELGDYIRSKLNAEQSGRLDEILHDDNALKEILSTPRAQELFRKLTEDKNGQS